jgi:hypothetical protein
MPTTLTMLKMPTTPTMLTMPSLPTTLDIHSNSHTSGFHVPSALVNITYIPTLWFALSVKVVFSKVCSIISFVTKWLIITITSAFKKYSIIYSFLAAYREAISNSEDLYYSLSLVKQRLRNIISYMIIAKITKSGFYHSVFKYKLR